MHKAANSLDSTISSNTAHSTSSQSQPSNDRRSSPYRESTTPNEEEERSLRNRIQILTSHTLSRTPSLNMGSLGFVGSPDFQPSHPHRPPAPRRSRSRATSLAGSVEQRLSVIEEDQPSPPHQQLEDLPERPLRAHHRPWHQRFGLGEPPTYRTGGSPPGYTFWDVKGPKGEKFEDLRNNAYIARRGGWRRLCIILWILVLAIVALSVGLGIGLNKKSKNK